MTRKQSAQTTNTQHTSDTASDSRRDVVNSYSDSQEDCIICADPITWYAVGPCNHRTCHVCTLRLRALYKNANCTYCKTEQPSVVFTAHPSKPFDEFTPQDLQYYDEKTKISFDNKEIYDETMVFLLFNCPDKNCDVSCNGGWSELKTHVKKAHSMVLCDLCTRFKKIFCHEHTLFTHAELERHLRGEVLSNEVELSGFKGHPKCGFCRIAFYGDDELFDHCRKNHEQCFLCQRMGIEGARNQYFANYNALEKHFRLDHLLCEDEGCLAQKFVVFSSDIDFKAHLRDKHPNYDQGRQRSDQNRAMQIQVNFTYGGGSDQTRDTRGRDGRQLKGSKGRERERNDNEERNPNASPRGRQRSGNRNPDIFSLPGRGAVTQTSNTALHPGREQNIRQQGTVHALAALNDLSNFGGHHCRQDGTERQQTVTRRQRQQEQWPGLGEPIVADRSKDSSKNATSAKPPPGFGRLMDNETDVPDSATQEQSVAVDPETAQRHAAFLRQVAGYLQNDKDKLQQFRKHVNTYRGGVTSASQFVENLARIFGAPNSVDVIGKVVTRLVALLGDNEEKGPELLRSWNDKKITMQSGGYPNLDTGTTAASVAAGMPAKSVTRKVLVIKSQNSTNARSGTGRRETWDRIAKAASSTSSMSPLQQRAPSPAGPATPYFANSGAPPTAWTGSSILPKNTATPSVQPTLGTQAQPVRNQTPNRPEAFPMLPRATTPAQPQWGKQRTGNESSSAWSSPKGGQSKNQEEEDFQLALALSLDDNESGAGSSSQRMKKKSGKKKKVLLHFG